ncbi:helix-turn-helix domain-containing protein [Actinomyces wuliandei]|uniref:helix-turn-helix domain-containing protein n=1 Tax=Actinomyces wuliandei TaxID=2057743 RepID=UPI00111BB3CC|nr:helix-turn-helix domain-containing protein [Actinomyces wuliandei]
MSNTATGWAWSVEGVDSQAKFVLVALADQADEYGYCWPSQALIAERVAMGVRTVRRHIRTLRELGLLTPVPRSSTRGRRSNGYHLHVGKEAGLSARSRQPARLAGCDDPVDDLSAEETPEDPVSVGSPATGQTGRLRKRPDWPVAQEATGGRSLEATGGRLLPIREPSPEPPDLTRPQPPHHRADSTAVGSGRAETDQGPNGGDGPVLPAAGPEPGPGSGRGEALPGGAGPGVAGATTSAQEASGAAPSETRRLVKACLPEHLRALDASGARQVAALLRERVQAGWRPGEIRALMDQPLPERTGRVSSLVAYRLRTNVDPALAPATGPATEQDAQDRARHRADELAGTSRDRDPAREAAEAQAWQQARHEAPGATRLELALRVSDILAAGTVERVRETASRRTSKKTTTRNRKQHRARRPA